MKVRKKKRNKKNGLTTLEYIKAQSEVVRYI